MVPCGSSEPKSPDSNRYVWLNRDFDPAVGPARGDFLGNFFWYQPALNYGYAEPSEPWQDSVDAPVRVRTGRNSGVSWHIGLTAGATAFGWIWRDR